MIQKDKGIKSKFVLFKLKVPYITNTHSIVFLSTSSSLLEGLGFSSGKNEQARTGKMNDINGQPILPGTRDWDKWALLL